MQLNLLLCKACQWIWRGVGFRRTKCPRCGERDVMNLGEADSVSALEQVDLRRVAADRIASGQVRRIEQ